MFIYDIIEKNLSTLDRTLHVTAIGNGWIRVCDLKWVGLFGLVLVDGVEIQYSAIDEETNTIFILGNYNENTEFKLPESPLFVGTHRKASSEWLNYSNDLKDKIPFVWFSLFPNPTKTKSTDRSSIVVDSWSNVRIYFCADIDRTQWVTVEILERRAKWLDAWAEAFCNNFDNYLGIDLVGSPTFNYYPVFGVEQSDGMIKDIIDSNLASVGISIDLDVKFKECKC